MTIRRSMKFESGLQTPAAFRCLIASLGTVVQLFVFSQLLVWPLRQHLLLWCWIVALDVGITFGVYGFCSAGNWKEGILAFILLCFQFISFCILFLIAISTYIATHGVMSSIR